MPKKKVFLAYTLTVFSAPKRFLEEASAGPQAFWATIKKTWASIQSPSYFAQTNSRQYDFDAMWATNTKHGTSMYISHCHTLCLQQVLGSHEASLMLGQNRMGARSYHPCIPAVPFVLTHKPTPPPPKKINIYIYIFVFFVSVWQAKGNKSEPWLTSCSGVRQQGC